MSKGEAGGEVKGLVTHKRKRRKKIPLTSRLLLRAFFVSITLNLGHHPGQKRVFRTNYILKFCEQVRLSKEAYITDVATQGRYSGSEYTSSYTLKYLDPYISSPETWRDVKVRTLCVPKQILCGSYSYIKR